MHVTIDCRICGKRYGGIGRYVFELVSNLIKITDWNFTLIIKPEFSGCFLYSNKVKECIVDADMFSLKEQWLLWRVNINTDIFWAPYINVPFLPILAQKKIVTIHDVFHKANPSYYSLFKRLILDVYYYYSSKMGDVVLTVSRFSKDEIRKYLGEDVYRKTHVVYNGCDIKRQKYSKSKIEKKYILYVGNVKPHKNLKNALLAYYNYVEEDVMFVIVGKKDGFITSDNQIFDIIEELECEYKSVFFTGVIDDDELYSYYCNASVLVVPSFYEGFGLPIIEAMTFNIPIACSDIPVFREIGNNHLMYFDPNDPKDIGSVLTNSLKIKEVVYDKWNTWNTSAKEIVTLFEDLLNKN